MAEVSSQTLHIVARELAAELNEARAALEAFGEQQDSLALLCKCHEHLRSVHGALRIAEVYGAALLVEEMGQVACYLIENFEERRHLAEGLDALMRAMVQLPTYLERVLSGGRDMALVLLPLLNDLRAVRGHALLSEGTLLLLNLSSDQQANPVAATEGEASLTVAQWARKLRTRFQLGLLGWIKGERVDQNLEILARTAEKLEQVATTQPVFQLWWVVGAVLEGLREGGLEGSASVKRLLGQADRDMRRLYELGEVRYADSPALELLNNLLYYVARARSLGPRVAAVRASFRLNELLPADDSIDEARESLSAPSVKLMKTVAAAIKEDLGRVKDALDIFVRQGGTQVDELAPQLELLKKIADTLGVLGLGELRDKVQAEAGDLQAIVTERIAAGDDTLLRMAATLIKVEDSLDEQLVGMIVPGAGTRTSVPDAVDGPDEIEFRQVTEAVLRECIVNLARIKEAVAQLVEKPREAQAIDQIPQLTRGIIAGLLMLGKTRAVETMEGINRMLGRFVRSDGLTLPQEAMDRLADAVVAVEYYMETLQAGRADPWYMLDNAETCLRFLADAQPIPQLEADDSDLTDPARTVVIESNAQTFALPTQHEPTAVLASMPTVNRGDPVPGKPEAQSGTDESALPAAIVMPHDGDIDPEFLELFIEEAKDEIGRLRELFPRWDENPQDLEALVNVRRSFHTLKGSGRMVGAQLIGEFAWAIENLLNRVISKTLERTPEMMSLLRESVAAVPELVEQLETGRDPNVDIARLIGQANAIAGIRPGAGSSKTSPAPSSAARPVPPPAPELVISAAVSEEKKTPPGTPESSVPSADRMDPVLHDIYAKETAGHLATIREYLAACKTLAAPYPVTESLHRSCHTLSGTAKTAGARQGIKVAEPLNRYIRKLYDNSVGLPPAGLEVLRDSVAAIQQVVDHIDEDTGFFANQASIVVRLEALEHDLDTEISRLAEVLDGTVSTPALPRDEATLVSEAAVSLIPDDENVLDILNWSYENFPSDSGGAPEAISGNPDAGLVDDDGARAGIQPEEIAYGEGSTVIIAGIGEGDAALEEASIVATATDADAASPDSNDFAAQQDMPGAGQVDRIEEDDSNILIDETGEQEAAGDLAAASAEESTQTIVVETEAWAAEFDPPELASVMRISSLDAGDVNAVPEASETSEIPEAFEASDVGGAPDAADVSAVSDVADAPEVCAASGVPGVGVEPAAAAALPAVGEEEDDFDPDIAAIFTEEATELLESADQSLSAWMRDRTNGALVFELKRLVHTLKGGARMAGIRAMGDLSHELETLMQRVEAKEVPAEQAVFDALQASLDELNRMRDMASDGQRCRPAHALVDHIRTLAGLAPIHPGISPAPAQALLEPAEAAFDFSLAATGSQPDGSRADDWQADDGSQTDMVPTLTDPFESAERVPEEAGAAPEAPAETIDIGEQEHRVGVMQAWAWHEADAPQTSTQDASGSDTDTRDDDVRDASEPGIDSGAIDDSYAEVSAPGTPPPVEMPIDAGEDAQAPWRAESDVGSGVEPAAAHEPTGGVAASGSLDVAGLAPELPLDEVSEPALEVAVLPGREPQAQERHEVARVDADLLDDLLNNAGEVSIFRSRLEQQISSIEFNLAELGRTVTRLKEQLRKLELETEAQILHRHEAEHPGRADFDPLELDRYSSIQQLSRAFAESVSDVSSIEGLLENLTREAQNLLLQQSRVVTEMQNGLMRTRMVPFQRHVQRLSRLVRQVANETGKQAELVVTGASGELDRQVLDRMLPPLEHMLRNSIIHGIEFPQERLEAGKPERGTIKVGLHREGSEMVIVLEDDGRGIDVQAVRERARLRGLLQSGRELSDEEALQLILEPGFSTASTVTQHAGRGVGMDVVVTEIKKLGGALFTRSRYGHGAQFTIRLPFTLAITQALIVRTGEEMYALPLPSVEGVARVPRSKVQQHLAEDTPSFDYGGQIYRFQHLGVFVGGAASVLPEADVSIPVILIRAGEHSTAIVTDELIGSREMVVKSVGPQIAAIRGIAGATILGDGRIVIILDMGSLVRSEWRGHAALKSVQAGPDRRALALVVDDSITVRRVTQRLLERNGMRVMTAKDGVDALSILQEHSPDVILLDIEMPRMDGYELAAHVRADARLADIPIVMITSRVGEKHRARAIELGVNDYLGKPYQENQLLDAIEPLISVRRRNVS